MALINVAYHTLSNPVLRAEHDDWIRREDAAYNSEAVSPDSAATAGEFDPPSDDVERKLVVRSAWETRLPFEVVDLAKHIHRHWGWYVCAAISLIIYFGSQPPTPVHPAPIASNQPARPIVPPPPPPPAYIRPNQAPNGYPWPTTASYISGYPRLNLGGNSEVTVDNSQNENEVFVKIMLLSGARPQPIRHFYIPGGQSFTAKGVRPGQYDVRYQSLSSGARMKTESFELTEVQTDDGIRYHRMRMTLYRVRDGNMQTTEISEDDFE
jgi:hypothetical protein